ncbi:hypothetical protein GCM10020331_022200 [Ectobacillus funiculus]
MAKNPFYRIQSSYSNKRSKRIFLTDSEKTADQQIQAFAKIMMADNLPVPKSWETEVTTSTNAPFFRIS